MLDEFETFNDFGLETNGAVFDVAIDSNVTVYFAVAIRDIAIWQRSVQLLPQFNTCRESTHDVSG